MRSRGPLMFYRLAPYYDAFVQEKDYRGEVRRLTALARRYGRPDGTSWLDVACGTGKHLEVLRRRHPCVGVDASPEMLRIARRRLPGVRLVEADMRSFDLGRRFDVVTCLFSAIGHLPTERDLKRTFRNFERHLKPGGVVIVEPWISPGQFRPGHLHLVTYRQPNVTLVRLAHSRRRGQASIIQYCYLLGESGRGIRYLEETHRELLVDPRRLQHLLRGVGFAARFLRPGFMGDRGLLVGVKPSNGSNATGKRRGAGPRNASVHRTRTRGPPRSGLRARGRR